MVDFYNLSLNCSSTMADASSPMTSFELIQVLLIMLAVVFVIALIQIWGGQHNDSDLGTRGNK